MKLTKKQQQFIKDLAENINDCFLIKETFPKLFKETELVVGKWYKHDETGCEYLICYTGDDRCYGFFDGDYDIDLRYTESVKTEHSTPATDKEVSEALIKEAKKRNVWETPIKCLAGKHNWDTNNCYDIDFDKYSNKLWSSFGVVFEKGKWATIIETITKEQAEKELGKTIKG